eukprot:CAMPEP_0183725724 /NCGR_PEP_ID=MMETSP0737-20130205/21351_1 /TAXON_ID=385413 /ORGANISM="Thalassiosira miniscula, Strain CCMP1093" /LENGTH=505 /DNA_ID=CAMNT_0025956813 /DNA_START=98 /DNA_END=1612 /DNA_ORIENTATION=-
MNSNQHHADSIAPSRVSILVETGVSEGGRSSASDGIGGLRVEGHDAGRMDEGAGGMSPGSDMAIDSDAGPTAIPADEGDVSRPSGAAKVDCTAGLGAAGVDTVTPREGETMVQDGSQSQDDEQEEEEGDENNQDDDVADDESDYSYTYEDEDEGNYSGFLIPTDPIETGNHNDSTAAISASDGNDINLVASEDMAASGNDDLAAAGGGQQQQPRTISRAASRASDPGTGRSSPVPETNPQEKNDRKQKWREPTRAAVNMSLRAEKEKTGGRRRLASDLYKIMMADTVEAGFSLEPTDEDSMEKWCIKLFGFDDDSNLAKDLLVCGMDHVELEMSFPDQYPFEPPFVRVVRPRFRRQTGFVMSGALCMELLTKDGWNPINDIESVIVSIRSLMVVGDGRLQAAVDMGKDAYKKTLDEMMKKKEQKKEGKSSEGEAAMDLDDGDVKMGEAKRKRAPSVDNHDHEGKPKGKPVVKKATGGSYTAAEAQSAYEHLSKYHKKEGWDKSGW